MAAAVAQTAAPVASPTTYAAGLSDIQAAAGRIAGHAHVTPVMRCSTLDRLAGGHNLFFKCEIFQKG
jgi:threonine dehydratase